MLNINNKESKQEEKRVKLDISLIYSVKFRNKKKY